jgi:hypothetical protein
MIDAIERWAFDQLDLNRVFSVEDVGTAVELIGYSPSSIVEEVRNGTGLGEKLYRGVVRITS